MFSYNRAIRTYSLVLTAVRDRINFWLVDHAGRCSPQKDCCLLRLTLQHPVWKSSVIFRVNIKMAYVRDSDIMASTQVVRNVNYMNQDD